ncbi:MAG: S-adenosylmethionine:tRNA ribosyltransferase-isomerase [Candidatus Symbiothrix sp.]|jgi:S-adenosylmethionine:tRNA ribosyltransferase-isomerase|nr:S-adenosylmethionine:tRNA ribosyltransferase-isomerase [Candidatus Symbiothrix sp.]
MIKAQDINIEEFNYDLPDERIAKFPLPQRDQSKLLVYRRRQLPVTGYQLPVAGCRLPMSISESQFSQISTFLPENALLVFNNTKVIQARLMFQKATGASIEIFCLEPKEPSDYAQAFVQNRSCTWLCMVGNSKRWKGEKLTMCRGEVCSPSETDALSCTVTVERLANYGDTHLVRFEWNNPDWSFAAILEKFGELPIPPYLNRKTEERDKETYQTIYSKIKGSVAAPTAGLHFTDAVFESLKKKHIALEELTLHVGAGTFKPVKANRLAGHEMHTECISVKKSTIEKLLSHAGQVFAVGTTSVRTLESLYYIGTILEENPDATPDDLAVAQWAPYVIPAGLPPSRRGAGIPEYKALQNILDYMTRRQLTTLTTHTRILIAPGYEFKIVNGIITNFHQPKSTLLLLISAFIGDDDWRKIYDYALAHNFRFLSYGDSSLLM